ncbi:MAG TPA: gene transfer agent family protein [Hyphomicrobiaceae bacterium]|nr:gene transfer agent family protein [Hyphomicrobiaceae bacterium]
MANLHRGEIDAVLDGQPLRLCLTLGALAELESTFGDEDMLALAERFGRGRLSARDAVRIIGAGLRGAGHQFTDDAVARMRAEGGAAGFVDIVSRLLNATFGAAEDAPMAKAVEAPASPPTDAGNTNGPFPGAT